MSGGKIKLSICMLFCIAAFIASPAFASAKDDLLQTKKDMEQSQQKQEELAEESRKLEDELKDLQEKLVTLAETIQKAEFDLSDAEEKLRILNDQLKQKSEELKEHQKNLATLVQAALSLSHTPPEAMVMMPGDAAQTIKAARALKMTSDSVRQETKSIGLQIVELQNLKQKVSENRDALAKKQDNLSKERQKMTDQLAERTDLQKKLGRQQKQEAGKLARLAKKAEDLQDLLTSIEKEEVSQDEEEQKAEKAQKTTETKPEETAAPEQNSYNSGSMRSFVAAKGHIRTPVTGRVVQAFGAAQGKNTTSKGIVINARPSASVTAPYDGEVVFTGPFLNYGQMVIIRHSDDFHTLLAGLTKIDVDVGQFLLEGEPIGAMGDSESGNHQENKLYIELRKNNQPVNPALWISGLNKKN